MAPCREVCRLFLNLRIHVWPTTDTGLPRKKSPPFYQEKDLYHFASPSPSKVHVETRRVINKPPQVGLKNISIVQIYRGVYHIENEFLNPELKLYYKIGLPKQCTLANNIRENRLPLTSVQFRSQNMCMDYYMGLCPLTATTQFHFQWPGKHDVTINEVNLHLTRRAYFTSEFIDSRSRTVFVRELFSFRFSFSCPFSDFSESFVLHSDSNNEKLQLRKWHY